MDIIKWLNNEEKIQNEIWYAEKKKNKKRNVEKLEKAIAKQKIDFIEKYRNKNIINLHPKMLEYCKNII